jgi:hypothetical protein
MVQQLFVGSVHAAQGHVLHPGALVYVSHFPPMQISVGPQIFPQPPQFAGSRSVSVQYGGVVVPTPPHRMSPPLHPPVRNMHEPPVHV